MLQRLTERKLVQWGLVWIVTSDAAPCTAATRTTRRRRSSAHNFLQSPLRGFRVGTWRWEV
jgi:hypothetical protein